MRGRSLGATFGAVLAANRWLLECAVGPAGARRPAAPAGARRPAGSGARRSVSRAAPRRAEPHHGVFCRDSGSRGCRATARCAPRPRRAAQTKRSTRR
ncbi:MAG: hypothetical protein E6J14_08605 [Chloroflexi bacterium]|nr:MAG: hypothetical protein E6J14_08605 [Chloroflexota bacterium]